MSNPKRDYQKTQDNSGSDACMRSDTSQPDFDIEKHIIDLEKLIKQQQNELANTNERIVDFSGRIVNANEKTLKQISEHCEDLSKRKSELINCIARKEEQIHKQNGFIAEKIETMRVQIVKIEQLKSAINEKEEKCKALSAQYNDSVIKRAQCEAIISDYEYKKDNMEELLSTYDELVYKVNELNEKRKELEECEGLSDPWDKNIAQFTKRLNDKHPENLSDFMSYFADKATSEKYGYLIATQSAQGIGIGLENVRFIISSAEKYYAIYYYGLSGFGYAYVPPNTEFTYEKFKQSNGKALFDTEYRGSASKKLMVAKQSPAILKKQNGDSNIYEVFKKGSVEFS